MYCTWQKQFPRLKSPRFALILLLLAGPAVVQGGASPGGDEFTVPVQTLSDQDRPSVAAAPDGTFAVTWTGDGADGDVNGVFLRRFDAAGNPLTGDVLVNGTTDDEQEDSDLAFLSDGRIVVVWDSNDQDGSLRGVYARLLSAAGVPQGDEIQVNSTTAGDQNDPVVAAASDGGFLVAWEDTPVGNPFENLLAQRFDADGDPVGSVIAVNTFLPDDQEDLDIGVDGSGNYVMVWESEGQDGDFDSVRGRRFGPDGQPLAAEFPVNTFTDGNQDDADLSVAADGSFTVVWEDDEQDGFQPAIYARHFAADGTPVADPFKVDSFAGPEMNPRLSHAADGTVVIIWDSLGQDGGGIGVSARRFDAQGEAVGGERRVNQVTAGDQLLPDVALQSEVAFAVWEGGIGQDGSGLGVFGRILDLAFFWDNVETGDLGKWALVVPSS